MKNGTYGALRGFSKLLSTGETPGLDVPGLDFVQIANGYGVAAESVSTTASLRAALIKALGSNLPSLIEINTQFEG